MNPYLLISINQIYTPAAPNDVDSTKALMGKLLSHRSQVICVLEAAKMALPIWTKYAVKNLSKKQKEAPRKAIETIEKWLGGKATIEEVRKAADAAAGAADAASASDPAYAAARAAADAAYAARVTYAFATATSAVANAVYAVARTAFITASDAKDASAVAVANAVKAQFYSEWWDRCYSLIGKEFQNEYNLLCKSINGDI